MAHTDQHEQAGGSFLTRKLGPLPMWAWIIIGGAGAYYFTHRGVKAAAAASTVPADTTSTGTDSTADDLLSMLTNGAAGTADNGGATGSGLGSGVTGPGTQGSTVLTTGIFGAPATGQAIPGVATQSPSPGNVSAASWEPTPAPVAVQKLANPNAPVVLSFTAPASSAPGKTSTPGPGSVTVANTSGVTTKG